MHARVISPCLLFVVLFFTALTSGENPDQSAPPETLPEKPIPRRIQPHKIDPPVAGRKAVEQFDANKDGKLSGAELDKCPGLKSAIENVDADGNGEITAQEISDRIQNWLDSKLGRMSFRLQVLHNGKPLEGAEVKYVPEKFLGESFITATGKTDNKGMVHISMPGFNPPGIAPGFYRVEITKAGEKIPAKYNTKTIFGQEIALDAKGIQEGIVFDLKY